MDDAFHEAVGLLRTVLSEVRNNPAGEAVLLAVLTHAAARKTVTDDELSHEVTRANPGLKIELIEAALIKLSCPSVAKVLERLRYRIEQAADDRFLHSLLVSGGLKRDIDSILQPLSPPTALKVAVTHPPGQAIERNFSEGTPTALEIAIDFPDGDLETKDVRTVVRAAVEAADLTHRSLGGKGLTVHAVEVFEEEEAPTLAH